MKTQQFLAPVMRMASVPQSATLSRLGVASILGWAGSRRRSRRQLSTGSVLIGAGVLIGAAAAYLFGSSSGRDLRTRVGKRLGSGVGQTVGKLVGEQAGAHPIGTAHTVKKAREAFSSS
jgi:hypothetical protein